MIFAFFSGQTLTLLGVAAILIFGPSKLPELARSLGEGIREFKKASVEAPTEFKKGLEEGNEHKSA